MDWTAAETPPTRDLYLKSQIPFLTAGKSKICLEPKNVWRRKDEEEEETEEEAQGEEGAAAAALENRQAWSR